MEIKIFNELDEKEIEYIIEKHYEHWKIFDPVAVEDKDFLVYKYKEMYTNGENMPFGIALYDENVLRGYCILKKENLKKYPQYSPWISEVMILKEFRGEGYGKILIEEACGILKNKGFGQVYLWTNQVSEFYKKLGFEVIERTERSEGLWGDLFKKKL